MSAVESSSFADYERKWVPAVLLLPVRLIDGDCSEIYWVMIRRTCAGLPPPRQVAIAVGRRPRVYLRCKAFTTHDFFGPAGSEPAAIYTYLREP